METLRRILGEVGVKEECITLPENFVLYFGIGALLIGFALGYMWAKPEAKEVK